MKELIERELYNFLKSKNHPAKFIIMTKEQYNKLNNQNQFYNENNVYYMYEGLNREPYNSKIIIKDDLGPFTKRNISKIFGTFGNTYIDITNKFLGKRLLPF